MPSRGRPVRDLGTDKGFYSVLDVVNKLPAGRQQIDEVKRRFPGSTDAQARQAIGQVLDATRFGERATQDLTASRDRDLVSAVVPGFDPGTLRVEGFVEFYQASTDTYEIKYFRLDLALDTTTEELRFQAIEAAKLSKTGDRYEGIDVDVPTFVQVDFIVSG